MPSEQTLSRAHARSQEARGGSPSEQKCNGSFSPAMREGVRGGGGGAREAQRETGDSHRQNDVAWGVRVERGARGWSVGCEGGGGRLTWPAMQRVGHLCNLNALSNESYCSDPSFACSRVGAETSAPQGRLGRNRAGDGLRSASVLHSTRAVANRGVSTPVMSSRGPCLSGLAIRLKCWNRPARVVPSVQQCMPCESSSLPTSLLARRFQGRRCVQRR